MLFQLIWNPVPDEMEQGYILAVTNLKLKKFITRVCKVVNES
ncbi:MAG: thioesterase [Prevotella sp.]|nr:MAG: thioesterase [Prevotella sp.]